MVKLVLCLFLLSCSILCANAFADSVVKSSKYGSAIIFSRPVTLKQLNADVKASVDRGAYQKIFFKKNKKITDISLDEYSFDLTSENSGGRYYVSPFPSLSKLSASERYVMINLVEGGILDDGETRKYVDRAYCSIIDMSNGCIIRTTSGDFCAGVWDKKDDIFQPDFARNDSDTSNVLNLPDDFPRVKEAISYDKKDDYWEAPDIKNILRCDALSRANIDSYYFLLNNILTSPKKKDIIQRAITDWSHSIKEQRVITQKTYLYSAPDSGKATKQYLVKGDSVKVIDHSEDKQWMHFFYLTNKGRAIIGWFPKSTQ